MALYTNKKIEIRKSLIHGWGVFAKDKIYKNEILEESPYLILPIKKGESSNLLIDYRFNFPSGKDFKYQVVVLGFGSIYNHSNEPNCCWITDETKNIFIFKTLRDIEKNEEILVYYGDENYWKDGRLNIKII